jgi:hypothetical protein
MSNGRVMADTSSSTTGSKGTDTVISLLSSLPEDALRYVQITIALICLLMIVGGLLVFYIRSSGAPWRPDYIQVLGTIFFFPTLIILAVYLNMSRDAVVGILGAFLGSLFTRNTGPSGQQGGPTSTDSSPSPRPSPRIVPSPKENPSGGSRRRSKHGQVGSATPEASETAAPVTSAQVSEDTDIIDRLGDVLTR